MKAGVAQACRLENVDPARARNGLDRGIGYSLATAARTVGLGDDADHGVRRGDEPFEGWNRKFRRAEEHDPHRRYHLPALASFLIFLTIRSFCRPRRRSTNNVPSR